MSCGGGVEACCEGRLVLVLEVGYYIVHPLGGLEFGSGVRMLVGTGVSTKLNGGENKVGREARTPLGTENSSAWIIFCGTS